MKKLLLCALLFLSIQIISTSYASAQDATKTTDGTLTTDDAQSSVGTVNDQDYAFINNTGTTIHSIYFSKANMSEYGNDILVPGTQILTTNSYAYKWADFPLTECLWDIKYTTVDGTDYVVEDVDMCKSPTITFVGLTK